MRLSSDQYVLWHFGIIKLSLTVATTWFLIVAMTLGSWLLTRRLKADPAPSRWQSAFEIIVTGLKSQIEEIGLTGHSGYLSFLGTLFLFIAVSNLCTLLPFYEPPTGSLSTTAALAICVFFAVPAFGIRRQGLASYLKSFLSPTPLMLPFNVLGEFTRSTALAIRLFGNIMSGSMILAILLTITPLFFPIVMSVLGLLTGMVQAYIFTVLAAVYIAAAVQDAAAQAQSGSASSPAAA